MAINDWSEDITIAELNDEPNFSEEVNTLLSRLDQSEDNLPDVIVDLKDVTFLNSSNIAQLLRLRQIVHSSSGRLRICSVNDQVWTMLILTGLDKLFDFTDDVATSLASLQIEPAE